MIFSVDNFERNPLDNGIFWGIYVVFDPLFIVQESIGKTKNDSVQSLNKKRTFEILI